MNTANSIHIANQRIELGFRSFVLVIAISLLFSTSAWSSTASEARASYRAALKWIAEAEDGDQYAVERLKYVIAKVRYGDERCADQECRELRERDVLLITKAILKTDPTSPIWRDLKLCETADCAVALVPSVASDDSSDRAAANGALGSPDAIEGAPQQRVEAPMSEASAVAPPKQAKARISPERQSGAVREEASTNASPRSPFAWIPFVSGAGVLAALYWFLRLKKCPQCNSRGTSVRVERKLIDKFRGQRMKNMKSRTYHRSSDENGIMRTTGESVTEYRSPVPTVTSIYRERYICKKCGKDYTLKVSSTRDL